MKMPDEIAADHPAFLLALIYDLQIPSLGEVAKTAIIGFLGLRREAAARQLLVGKVIFQTLTADPASIAGHIRAGAGLGVLGLLAFHDKLPWYLMPYSKCQFTNANQLGRA